MKRLITIGSISMSAVMLIAPIIVIGVFLIGVAAVLSDDNGVGSGEIGTGPTQYTGETLEEIPCPPDVPCAELIKLINQAATKYGISPAVIAGVMEQESGFHPGALSSAGAIGLMQLMPSTCKDVGYTVFQCWLIPNNIDAGAHVMANNLEMFHNDLILAAAAYNAGPGAVQKYDGVPPYEETQHYVRAVSANYEKYSDMLEGGQIQITIGSEGGPFLFPADGPINSIFGLRWGKMHEGIDIDAPLDSPIRAAADGKVVLTKTNPGGFGFYIDIDHGKLIGHQDTRTRYGHMYQRTVTVHEGQQVKKGDIIALVGANGQVTGPHLHFEVRLDGRVVDPFEFFPHAKLTEDARRQLEARQ